MEETVFLVKKLASHKSIQVEVAGNQIGVIQNCCQSWCRFTHQCCSQLHQWTQHLRHQNLQRITFSRYTTSSYPCKTITFPTTLISAS